MIFNACSGGASTITKPTSSTLEDLALLNLQIVEIGTLPAGGEPGEIPIEVRQSEDTLTIDIFVPRRYQGLSLELGYDPDTLALEKLHRGGWLSDELPCLLLKVERGHLALSAAAGENEGQAAYGFVLRRGVDPAPKRLQGDPPPPYAGDPPTDVTALVGGSGVLVRFTEANFADYNGDGVVNGLDLFPLASNFNEHSDYNGQVAEEPTNNCIDANQDGLLNGLDLFPIATNFRDFNEGFRVYRSLEPDTGFTEITTTPVPHVNGHPQPPCFPTWEFLDDDPSGVPYWYRVTSMRDDEHTDESAMSEPATPNATFELELLTPNPQIGAQVVIAARVEGIYDLYSANFSLQFESEDLTLFLAEDHYLTYQSAFTDPIFLAVPSDPPGFVDANITEKSPNPGLIGGGMLMFIGFNAQAEGETVISFFDNAVNPFYLQDSAEMDIPATQGDALTIDIQPAG